MSYLECLRELKTFRKSLIEDADKKRGKLYFTWIKDKTEKIINEKNEKFIYSKVVHDTLPNYVITQYTYNKANKTIKSIIKTNYVFNDGKYTFNNSKNISR